MTFPAYILFEENDGVIDIKPVYLNTKEDAQFVGESIVKINELLFTTGYEVKAVKTWI